MTHLFMFLQAQVQDTLSNAAQGEGAEEVTLSFWELALKGGWIMLPIIILSIIAIYIFFERYFAITNAARMDTNFMNKIKDYIHDDKVESALTLCQTLDNPVARMIEKGIQIGRAHV